MGTRVPLKPGSNIRMPNQGQYVICERIGEGGLSLIYSAKTKANNYPVIIKEFFPAEHARRAKKTRRTDDGTIIEKKDRVYPDSANDADRFERCLNAFEQEGQLGSSARLHNFQVIPFSDCGGGYAVLPRWSADSCTFGELVKKWMRSPPVSVDPVFKDLGRLHFSLTAISSLLSAVASLHAQNILHLDISDGNVVWAGQDHTSPTNGSAFLADFGCSVYMENGAYAAEKALSCSEDYAAPEYLQKDGQLTEATDLYSVGKLLGFLCFGRSVFCDHAVLRNLVRRLNIADRFSKQLLAILEKSTAKAARERYQTAAEMQTAVNELLSALPLHPINEDCSSAFTLYSLKSMLEGSRDTHYSWAHELMDRRKVHGYTIEDDIHNSISHINFCDDADFLKAVLPESVWKYLCDRLMNSPFEISDIMSGNYPREWMEEICTSFRNDSGLRKERLLQKSKTLLENKLQYWHASKVLFDLLGNDGRFLHRCHQHRVDFTSSHVGLAMLIIYALVGKHCFQTVLVPSEREAFTFWDV